MEMKKRDDLRWNAVQQLKASAAESLPDENADASLIYNSLVRCGSVSIKPPLEEKPKMQFITMDPLRSYKKGNSMKPGNILLNIRKLMEAIPDMVSVGAGMTYDNLLLTVCAALSLWVKLRDIATVEISKEQAFVIVALWRDCDPDREIALDDGFAAVNSLLKQYGEPEITYLKYNMVVDSLVEMQCIELTEGIIWLRESTSRSYLYNI